MKISVTLEESNLDCRATYGSLLVTVKKLAATRNPHDSERFKRFTVNNLAKRNRRMDDTMI